jgi:hypothetical protein
VGVLEAGEDSARLAHALADTRQRIAAIEVGFAALKADLARTEIKARERLGMITTAKAYAKARLEAEDPEDAETVDELTRAAKMIDDILAIQLAAARGVFA